DWHCPGLATVFQYSSYGGGNTRASVVSYGAASGIRLSSSRESCGRVYAAALTATTAANDVSNLSVRFRSMRSSVMSRDGDSRPDTDHGWARAALHRARARSR